MSITKFIISFDTDEVDEVMDREGIDEPSCDVLNILLGETEPNDLIIERG